jgi:hypothetical protein
MDLGPTWPGHAALIGALGGILLLCRTAWQTAAPERVARRFSALSWWLLAALPWLVVWVYMRVAASGIALPGPEWNEYAPDNVVDQVTYVLKVVVVETWFVGGPLAALVSTLRTIRHRMRDKQPSQTNGV